MLTLPAARAQGEGLLELTRYSYMSNLAGARRAAAAAQASAALPADDGATPSRSQPAGKVNNAT